MSERKFMTEMTDTELRTDIGSSELGRAVIGLVDRVAELEKRERWIPTSENLPIEGEIVLAWREPWPRPLPSMVVAAKWQALSYGDHAQLGIPTHWRPMPAPPTKEQV